MTEAEQVVRNLVFSLSWHCDKGAGPKGMDLSFLQDAINFLEKLEPKKISEFIWEVNGRRAYGYFATADDVKAFAKANEYYGGAT